MNWPMGVFILQCVTLITVALVGSFLVQGLNRIEGILETIADLIAYDYKTDHVGEFKPDDAIDHETDHALKASKENLSRMEIKTLDCGCQLLTSDKCKRVEH